MEINFKTIKALSSPTRIQILHLILEKERTPTQISKEIDKSKSTVCAHLEELLKANLVSKDEKREGKEFFTNPLKKQET